jgi:hypothetical protein
VTRYRFRLAGALTALAWLAAGAGGAHAANVVLMARNGHTRVVNNRFLRGTAANPNLPVAVPVEPWLSGPAAGLTFSATQRLPLATIARAGQRRAARKRRHGPRPVTFAQALTRLSASGALTPSILGGAYSSTATTVVLARAQREAATERPELTVGMVVATAVMYLRIDVVVALFNRPLALLLLPPTVALFGLTAAIAAVLWWRGAPASAQAAVKLPVANPLQLLAAVTFAALFVAVALACGWVRTTFGQPGVFGLAAISGVTDIDPFVLNLAQGSVAGMPLGSLAAAILIAASSNNVLKAVYAVAFGGMKLCRKPAVALLAVAVAGVAIALLY